MDYDLLSGTHYLLATGDEMSATTVLLDGKQRQTTDDKICITAEHQCSGDDDDGSFFELKIVMEGSSHIICTP